MNVFSAENLFAPAPSSVGRFVAPVREFELLDARECDEVRRAVYELRPNWTRRDRDLPFFTLGAASYLDAAGGRDLDYRRKANALNPLLQSRFGWLYANLREALSCAFERSFCFDDRLALPGFHIFLAHEEFASGGSFHFDLQYQHLDWSILGEIDPREQISMTLAIRLPAGGAGLMTWPIGYLETEGLSAEKKREIVAANRKPTFHPYEEGRLVTHSGHQLHQIAPMKDAAPEDERLTLQAHAMRVGSGFVLYW